MTRKITLAAALAAFAVLPTGVAQAQDAAAGEKTFRKCASCHSLEAGKRKVGPSLYGVIGRTAATTEGYKYSSPLTAAGEAGLVWDADNMAVYLADTNAFLKAYLEEKGVSAKGRSKMSFKLTKPEEQQNVIAYIESVAK
ncbi:MAG: c-type cytochrome [Alphaproteobacteria bacterium]|nr:c-type cytochrome [Alphaproteobacteria bacterium]